MSKQELAELIDDYIRYCQRKTHEFSDSDSEEPSLSGFADWLKWN